MDKRFLGAWIDPAPLAGMLGRTLNPWCLKYRVRLMAFDSPLITGSRGITPADLLFACQVCADEEIGGNIGWKDQLRIMRLMRNPSRFENYLKAFSDYIMIPHWPKFWEQKSKKSMGDKGIPWPLAIVSSLIAAGIQERRAWEMPECQAIWLNSALAIAKGADVAIMSPDQEAYMETEEAKDAAGPVSNPANVTS